MKAVGLTVLGLLCAASIAVAATARRPVALPSKSCCETCTVARFVPTAVPPVPASMITGALLIEMSLLATAALAVVLVRRPRPEIALEPRPSELPPATREPAEV